MSDETLDRFGPIEVFVVEFPSGTPSAAGFDQLLELVEAGHIGILDVEFVRVAGGAATIVDAAELGTAVADFVGAASGLLDAADLESLGTEVADGSLAAVIAYEELSVLHVFDAFEDAGATIAMEGHLTPIELDEALDATDGTN